VAGAFIGFSWRVSGCLLFTAKSSGFVFGEIFFFFFSIPMGSFAFCHLGMI
jgi:hypothetical protein